MTKIKKFMMPNVLTARANTPFNEIVQTFTQSKINHLPIVNIDGSIRGIISASDVLEAMHELDKYALNFQGFSLEKRLSVKEEMSSDVLTISIDDNFEEAINVFVEHGVHALPVVNKGKICGIITPFDILKAIYEGQLNLKNK